MRRLAAVPAAQDPAHPATPSTVLLVALQRVRAAWRAPTPPPRAAHCRRRSGRSRSTPARGGGGGAGGAPGRGRPGRRNRYGRAGQGERRRRRLDCVAAQRRICAAMSIASGRAAPRRGEEREPPRKNFTPAKVGIGTPSTPGGRRSRRRRRRTDGPSQRPGASTKGASDWAADSEANRRSSYRPVTTLALQALRLVNTA